MSIKLTDTQLVLLGAATQRKDLCLVAPPTLNIASRGTARHSRRLWLEGQRGAHVSVRPLVHPQRLRRGIRSYERRGYQAFEAALREIDKVQDSPGGRLTGMICPAQVDTCTEGLLRDAFSEANRRGVPYQIHAAQSLAEFHEIVRRHGKTPIEWLDSLGVLSPRTIIGHGIFLDHHPWTHWPETDDLEALARSGSTVAHCPTVFARRGIALRDFGRYVRRGVYARRNASRFLHRACRFGEPAQRQRDGPIQRGDHWWRAALSVATISAGSRSAARRTS
jgi:Amidohydrolase family